MVHVMRNVTTNNILPDIIVMMAVFWRCIVSDFFSKHDQIKVIVGKQRFNILMIKEGYEECT